MSERGDCWYCGDRVPVGSKANDHVFIGPYVFHRECAVSLQDDLDVRHGPTVPHRWNLSQPGWAVRMERT